MPFLNHPCPIFECVPNRDSSKKNSSFSGYTTIVSLRFFFKLLLFTFILSVMHWSWCDIWEFHSLHITVYCRLAKPNFSWILILVSLMVMLGFSCIHASTCSSWLWFNIVFLRRWGGANNFSSLPNFRSCSKCLSWNATYFCYCCYTMLFCCNYSI